MYIKYVNTKVLQSPLDSKVSLLPLKPADSAYLHMTFDKLGVMFK